LILGFAQIISAGRAGGVNAEIKRLLDKIVDKTRDLHSMVNDILEITEIQAGGLVHLSRHPVRIVPLVDKVLERISTRRMTSDVKITHERPSSPVPGVLGDEQAVERIIYHVVDNAVKFIPLRGEVTVSHRLAGDRLEVCVKDTGIGIAPEHLENIFEHFYQVESELNRSYSGVGLGLTITKRLADLLEATIDVKSQPGTGSTFRVGFPVAATGERVH
jgi:signal transduction histidine kinase